MVIGHNYIDNGYIGHNYTCDNYMGHNYVGSTLAMALWHGVWVSAGKRRGQ